MTEKDKEKNDKEILEQQNSDVQSNEGTINQAVDTEKKPVENATADKSASTVNKEGKIKDDSSDDSAADREKEDLKARLDQLEEQVELLETARADAQKQVQRLQADFKNYRQRVDKEKQGLSLLSKIELLEKILPVVDNFERALESSAANGDEFKKGVAMIYKQLDAALKEEGLEVIPTVDEPFDPAVHEALMQVEDQEKEAGIIIEELQKGYILKDKVIRPAMVKVAQ